jgi:hypothetical protein
MTPWRFDSEHHFERHCHLITKATDYMKQGDWVHAQSLLDAALAEGESPNARWNRAITLLSLGHWAEGWRDYESRWNMFPHVLSSSHEEQLRRDLPAWNGEPLTGKRLVVLGEAGFGDTIMMLRFLSIVDGEAVLSLPQPLQRLAGQLAPLLTWGDISERDVHIPIYSLMNVLNITPDRVPGEPYLKVDPMLREEWADTFYGKHRPMVGICWSSMRFLPMARSLTLERFLHEVELPQDSWLISVQAHDRETALAHGVACPELTDFADTAALMSVLDAIVSVDSAPLHLAGAIGHPDVTGILPAVPCWRWQSGAQWYPGMKFKRLQ